jgi:hypothetical protein
MLVTYFFTSSAALRANAMGLAEQGRLLPVFTAGVLIVIACASLARRFRLVPWEARAWIIGGILILPYAVASLWLVFAQEHHFAVIYLHPVLGPAAAFAAALIAVPFELLARRGKALRWLPSAASLAGCAFLAANPEAAALPERVQAHRWTLPETAAVTEAAMRRGWTFEDLVFRLQGDACRELLIGMSLVAPPPGAAAPPADRQLRVVKVAREHPALAGRDGAISLGPTAVALIREIESWLRPARSRACRLPIGSGAPGLCAGATPRAQSAFVRERFLFVSRSYPEIHALDLPPPYLASYEIPLAPAAGQSRDFTLTEPGRSDCIWHFTRAEGVRVEGPLPARRVRLHSDDGGPALLVVEKPFGTEACGPLDLDRRYPPCLLETPPDDPLQADAGVS